MLSKIMIDVDEQGSSTIRISNIRNQGKDPLDDVRDKLVKRFLEQGIFGFVSWEVDDVVIHSMNALDVMQNILNIYGKMFSSRAARENFEQAVYTVSLMIESVSGERSTAFEKKVEAQVMSDQEECESYGAKYGFDELNNNNPGA